MRASTPPALLHQLIREHRLLLLLISWLHALDSSHNPVARLRQRSSSPLALSKAHGPLARELCSPPRQCSSSLEPLESDARPPCSAPLLCSSIALPDRPRCEARLSLLFSSCSMEPDSAPLLQRWTSLPSRPRCEARLLLLFSSCSLRFYIVVPLRESCARHYRD
ncbi:hypothetical protein L7F22_004104 [Adiantum nelumboides]|nr:hypothetical protein [Adiantum nelumboides]